MFVLLGPDNSGKTTFANKLVSKLNMRLVHYTKASAYEDYMQDLCESNASDLIMDRFAICEYPYSIEMHREFAFSEKQWQNMILTMLSYNPCVVLCTRIPNKEDYSDNYAPYESLTRILSHYIRFLEANSITYIPYDYMHWEANRIPAVDTFTTTHKILQDEYSWCDAFKRAGHGFIGSHHPELLIIAERIGPNNTYNIPFQTGPTGKQMTEFINYMAYPLGKLALTNMVKAPRRDMRKVDDVDLKALDIELDALQPKAVLLLGAVAKAAAPLLKKRKIQFAQVPHFGYYNRSGRGGNMIPIYEKYKGVVNELLGLPSGRTTLL